MKLYVYDHCPYCIRARMPFGLKRIPLDLIFVDNDDEDTPIRLIGQKMLPILEDADGAMAESLDIVAKLDALDGRPLFGGEADPVLANWLGQWGGVVNTLVIPRTPDPVFPEFHSESARAYFTAKKEATFGDFPGLIARTEEAMTQMQTCLEELVPALPSGGPSINDILLFPVLRSLTIVPELTFPPAVEAYVTRMAAASGVPLVSELKAQAA